MLQLLKAFQEQPYQITFVSTAKQTPLSLDLESMNIQTHSIRINDASFDELMIQLQPDIVIFDRFMIEEQFGWRVAQQIPNAIRNFKYRRSSCITCKSNIISKRNFTSNSTFKR